MTHSPNPTSPPGAGDLRAALGRPFLVGQPAYPDSNQVHLTYGSTDEAGRVLAALNALLAARPHPTIAPPDRDVAALRDLSARATPGPWFADSEKSDGSYGSGEDTHEGYDTAVILTEAETHYRKAGVLFESHNSTVGSIEEEHNDEYFRAWDAVSQANAKFIVALVNAYRAGKIGEAR